MGDPSASELRGDRYDRLLDIKKQYGWRASLLACGQTVPIPRTGAFFYVLLLSYAFVRYTPLELALVDRGGFDGVWHLASGYRG